MRRKLFKDSFIYVVLGFLPLGINLLLSPIYSKYINPTEFGLVGLAMLFQIYLMVIVGMGLPGSFARLYFDYHKKQKLVFGLLSTNIIAILVFSGILFLFLHFFGDALFAFIFKNDVFTFKKYGSIVFFTTVAICLHRQFLSYYRNKEDVKGFSWASLSFFFATIAGILTGIIYFKAQALGHIAGRAIGGCLIVGILLAFFYSKSKIYFKWKYLKISLAYSLPLIPYALLLAAYNSLDRILIERFFDLETLGLYHFAFLLASSVSVLIYSIFNALSPRIYGLLTDGSEVEKYEIKHIVKLFPLLIIGIIALIVAFQEPLVLFLLDAKYHSITSYLAFLFVIYIFQSYYVLFTIPIFYSKRTKLLPWLSLCAFIVGLGANLILIPKLQILGVCIAVFITKLAQMLVAYFVVKKNKLDVEGYFRIEPTLLLSSIMTTLIVAVATMNYYNVPYSAMYNLAPVVIFLLLVPFYVKHELTVVKRIVRQELKKLR